MPAVVIAGAGFVGAKVVSLFRDAKWDVHALARNQNSAAQSIACDITDRAALSSLAIGDAQLVIHCASTRGGDAEDYRHVYLEGVRNLLEIVRPDRFVFASSTSVYAQTDGSYVDETSFAQPLRETGKVLRETEEIVLAHNGVVARLGGIYGPGRALILRKFFENRATVDEKDDRFLNQIHRDDAASALFFLGGQNVAPGIYNVVDDEPTPQRECYQWLSDRFKKPMPPVSKPDLCRKRGWTNKRVSNAKLRNIGWRCRYPSFKDAVMHDPELSRGLRNLTAD